MLIEKKLDELGIILPSKAVVGALYVPVKQTGNLLFISGQVPMKDGIPVFTGKIGHERSISYGQDAAVLCIINILGAVKEYLGDLDQVKEVVKLQGFVNSETGFDKQHVVINAASQLLHDIFGESGRHARTALGTNQLPMDVSVEIEAIFEVRKGV
ncbi:RidA family protein [Fusibacter ferrireducens]|uniref:RidA family protein n=1 Tax=Fusibacter ferrireducens TaxID=2785058 RepID=A0ABR9ZTZ8_9FIRM|nr:RidA family protein [Fusibacter ferrireducens]MBF4693436.1 RidA family protein [Fusibacter ferrireducens]